jgi:hypothetical protein
MPGDSQHRPRTQVPWQSASEAHGLRPQVPAQTKFPLGQSAAFAHALGAQRASAPQLSPSAHWLLAVQPGVHVGAQTQPTVAQIIDAPIGLQSASPLHGSGGAMQMPQPADEPGGAQYEPGIAVQSLFVRHCPAPSPPPLPVLVLPALVLAVAVLPAAVLPAAVLPAVASAVLELDPPPVPVTSLLQAARRAGARKRWSAHGLELRRGIL